ncbi:MAG: flavodoxin domain-containing protein [Candidatus Aminicenantes bacterium]|nr:flavodoxin domain-containing protein [Candidatus Aminicenantes bacterium]
MKILVAYYSETGNTRKVAEAIFAAVHRKNKKLLAIDQVDDIASYDLVFCGFPVHHHGVPHHVARFLQSIPQGKKLVLFATHGSLRGGEKALSAFYAAISMLPGRSVIGTFGCRGQVSFQLLDTWMETAQHRSWAKEAQSANGHPDSSDLEDAHAFTETMLYAAEQFHGLDRPS